MIDQKIIDRLNFLSKKNKESGLSDDEIKERDELRKIYLKQFKEGFRQQLDNIEIVDENNPKA